MERSRTDIHPESFASNGKKLMTGVVLGVAAFVINYVAIYSFLKIDGFDAGNEGMPMWKYAGHALYNAQWVDTELRGQGESLTVNFVHHTSSNPTLDAVMESEVTSTVPELVYQLFPLVVLVLVSYWLCQLELPELDAKGVTGACITSGYFLATLSGLFLFEHSEDGATGAPETVPAILVVGLLLPLAFGALGGFVAGKTD